jgi:hypothetical protein
MPNFKLAMPEGLVIYECGLSTKKNEPYGSHCLELRIAGSMKKISNIKTNITCFFNYPLRQ